MFLALSYSIEKKKVKLLFPTFVKSQNSDSLNLIISMVITNATT